MFFSMRGRKPNSLRRRKSEVSHKELDSIYKSKAVKFDLVAPRPGHTHISNPLSSSRVIWLRFRHHKIYPHRGDIQALPFLAADDMQPPDPPVGQIAASGALIWPGMISS